MPIWVLIYDPRHVETREVIGVFSSWIKLKEWVDKKVYIDKTYSVEDIFYECHNLDTLVQTKLRTSAKELDNTLKGEDKVGTAI